MKTGSVKAGSVKAGRLKMATLVLAVVVLGVYLGDAIAFQVRVRRGTAYRVIEVNHFLTTPLKGQKEEFDVAGTDQVTCARALFPQPGAPACWWVERHTAEWQ